MPPCSKCGKEVPRRTAVYKVMQTGKYASGGAFMREVNLCPRCAAEAEKQEASQKKQKLVLMVVLVVAIVGAVFWFVLKQPPP